MKKNKIQEQLILTVLFLGLFPLTAFTLHKFYVSLCQIRFVQEESSVQVTLKIFTDDFEKALSEFSERDVRIGDAPDTTLNGLMKVYLQQHLKVEADGHTLPLSFLGSEVEQDVTWCYLEGNDTAKPQQVKVYSDLLTEVYPDQVNIVNVYFGDRVKGMMLTKDRPQEKVRFAE